MLKCKDCGVELEFYDTFDEGSDDGYTLYQKQVGQCPKCGQGYFWFDYFEYTSSSEPKKCG